MAFTKVLPVGISSESNLLVDSINSVGVVTATEIVATTGTFSGNVSVGGTLTYEDVSNIDSVGVITARNGLHVTSGNLGIGDANPSNELVVKSGSTPTIEINGQGRVSSLTLGVTANESKLFEGSNNALAFGTNNTERLRITSSGNIGIGTDNPNAPLHVETNGTSQILARFESNMGTNNNRSIALSSPTSDSGSEPFIFNTGNAYQFQTDDQVALHINYNGDVGIGTDNPDELLEVGNGTASGALKVSGQSSSVTSDGLTVDWESSSNSTRIFSEPSSGGSSAIRFFTTNSGTRAEKLRIDSNGNVGVNTDNPGVQSWRSGKILDIHGGAGNVTGELHLGANRGDGAQSVGSINFYDNTQDSTHRHVAVIESDKGGSTTNKRGGQLVFYTKSDNVASPAERLRITDGGYLWIRNNVDATAFTNNSTVTILTIGTLQNAVIKFIVQASDTGYRQHEWAGEYTAFVSDAAGSPGVSYYLKEHWQDAGSGNWNSPVVTVSINSSGQVQFNATNSNSDANGNVYVTVLSVISTGGSIPTIS